MNLVQMRVWFCVAVAAIAAAVTDPLVERASNAGVFGPGSYTDHSNWDVVPALCVGFVLAGTCVAFRVREVLWSSRGSLVSWLREAPRDLDAGRLVRLLPAAFAMQIATLYLMETTEQLVVHGRVLGAAIWLGAPILVSLAAHAVGCVATTLCIGSAFSWAADAAVRIVRLVYELGMALARNADDCRSRYVAPDRRRYAAPVPHLVGERAPPSAFIG
jgi:hypothetical protein